MSEADVQKHAASAVTDARREAIQTMSERISSRTVHVKSPAREVSGPRR